MNTLRDRYANSGSGKIPPPGGAHDLLEEPHAGEHLEPIGRALAVDRLREEVHRVAPGVAEGSRMEGLPKPTDKEALGPHCAPVTAAPLVAPALTGLVQPDNHEVVDRDDTLFSPQVNLQRPALDYPGTALTFERVETLQASRADSREKIVRALRQLIDDVTEGSFPWELLQPDFELDSKPKERSAAPRGSLAPVSSEVVVPLAKEIIRGRAVVACPSWFLLMLFFLAASCLAMIAEQGLLHAGACAHFLGSKLWLFLKLGFVLLAALAALAGLFYTLFSKPVSSEERIGVVFWPDNKATDRRSC
jgi:hypothetical protein